MKQLERGAVPPSDVVEQAQIKQALAAWEQAAAQAKEADRTLVRMERGSGRAQAEQLDARELADALQAGKPGPKAGKHVPEFERALIEAQRVARATAIVEQRCWDDAQAAFAAHTGELRQQTEQEFEKRRAAYSKAVGAVVDAHARMSALLAMRTFLAESGWGAGAYRAAGWATTMRAPKPNPLDDSQIAVADVLEELRWLGAERPAPPTNPAQLRPDGGQAPPQPRHLRLSEQGRVMGLAAPGGPAVRVPG